MKEVMSTYRKFVATVLLLWFLLGFLSKIGFNFGVNLSVFFNILLLIFLVLISVEAKKRRRLIVYFLKEVTLELNRRLTNRRESVQKIIIARAPIKLGLKTSGWITLTLTMLVIFLVDVFRLIKWLVTTRWIVLAAVVGVMLLFVFYNEDLSEFISGLAVAFFVSLWLLLAVFHRFEGRVTVAIGLIFLLACSYLSGVKASVLAERAAIYSYTFLAIGTVQLFIKSVKEKRGHLSSV